MTQISFDEMMKQDIMHDVTPRVVKKFWKFHSENPSVYQLFVKYADQVRTTGRKNYGTQAIAERIRWHVLIETKGDEFKINNDYLSCYARLIMCNLPRFNGFFKIRTRQK